MPQKLNHAGNMQNYVPKGNGEFSGEYGDNETGSNIHVKFKSFSKPKEENNKEQIKEQPKYEKGKNYYFKGEDGNWKMTDHPEIMERLGYEMLTKEQMEKIEKDEEYKKTQEALTKQDAKDKEEKEKWDKEHEGINKEQLSPEEYFKSHINDQKKLKLFTQTLSKGTPEMQKDYMELLNRVGTSYVVETGAGSAYHPSTRDIHFTQSHLTNKNDSGKTEGSTFYHETTHAIDFAYAEKRNKEFVRFYGDRYQCLSAHTHVEINGNLETFATSREKDIDNISFEKIQEMCNKEFAETQDENLNKEFESLKQELKGLLSSDNLMGNYSRFTYGLAYYEVQDAIYKPLKRKKMKELISKFNNSSEIERKMNKLYQDYDEQEARKEPFLKKWSSVSDMTQSFYGKQLDNVNFGHPNGYFNIDNERSSTEFFAEYMSAKATNKPQFDLMNKLFPNSSRFIEEMFKKIKNGDYEYLRG